MRADANGVGYHRAGGVYGVAHPVGRVFRHLARAGRDIFPDHPRGISGPV